MNTSSTLLKTSDNPNAPWMIGCLRGADTAVAHPLSRRDIEADAAFARTVFVAAGIGRGDVVLFTSGSAEYGQFWPYEVALESLGACIAIAENLPFDAPRSEMFLRRLSVAAVFGFGMPVLQGLRALNVSPVKAFGNTRVVFARDGVADELRPAGIDAWRMTDLGPAFLFESPDGVIRYDRMNGGWNRTTGSSSSPPSRRVPIRCSAFALRSAVPWPMPGAWSAWNDEHLIHVDSRQNRDRGAGCDTVLQTRPFDAADAQRTVRQSHSIGARRCGSVGAGCRRIGLLHGEVPTPVRTGWRRTSAFRKYVTPQH